MIKLKQPGPICSYNNQAYQVCINYDCKSNPFICNCQNKCQCESHHLQCDKINWQYIKNKLNTNIVKNNPQFQSFSNTVQSLYQSVIKQITKSYNDFKLWRDHFGLTQKQSQFFKLIEEGRYSEMTGQSIYEIRKQIKLPSKILLKDESDIKKEIQMINTYAQSILLQFNELHSKNKVEKIDVVENNENRRVNLDVSEQNKQLKLNLAHKLLGLNQKGSNFLTMLNEGIIEAKLQKMSLKIDSNQVSIKAVDLRIDKLTQTIGDHKNEMKTENAQSRNQVKTEISFFKNEINKEILQSRNQFKTEIQNYKNQLNMEILKILQSTNSIKKESQKENCEMINVLKNEISNIKNQMNKEIIESSNDIKKEISQLKNEVNGEKSQLKQEISQFKNQIKLQNNEMKKQFDAKILELRNENQTQYNNMKKQVTGIKKEATQFRNETNIQYDSIKNQIKTQYNDMIKAILVLKKQHKEEHSEIKNHTQILKYSIITQKKFKNTKFKVNQNIQKTFALQKKLLPFFFSSSQQQLKIQSDKCFNKIEQNMTLIQKNLIENSLPVEKLLEQFIMLQKQTELITRQYDLVNKGFEMLKINAISFLFPKKIVQLNLLYRASQNNFQVSEFWDNCNGKKDTITILKTQFGNVIGGYTPLAWDKNKTETCQWQTDNSMQSFIFSLTNKHKLKMIEGQQNTAIYHNTGWGPTFGGYDISIRDNANQNTNSWAKPGNTYNYNNEYVFETQQSYKKWSGQSIGYRFKIQQWQVYSIVFG